MSKIDFGKGITFPIKLENEESSSSDGEILETEATISLSDYEKDIKESILIILGTAKGERIMHPDFGCGIYDYVFAHMDVSTIGLMKSSIETSLTTFEPRIEITNVDINKDAKDQSILIISIDYKIKATGDELNLIYPFSQGGD